MRRIAVVGTRRVSAYGARVTEQFVRELVKQDYCIVSGLALGVDGIAHRTAIENGGKTIAVLAHGLDYCYPPAHATLKQEILDRGGLLVSEYPKGVRPTPDQFRARNRVLVQLSAAILVTAAPHKSGTKITVRYASELGKDVYVIPGPIDDVTCQGATEIIMNGGMPVGTPKELIDFLKFT
jgi:DNA processing protein